MIPSNQLMKLQLSIIIKPKRMTGNLVSNPRYKLYEDHTLYFPSITQTDQAQTEIKADTCHSFARETNKI